MYNHDATETAYRNGYEAGKRDAVQHGQWANVSGGRTICNQCGEYPLYDFFGRQKLSRSCPNCGAKMDGGKET